MKKYTFAEGSDASRGGKGIYHLPNGTCYVRVMRDYKHHYLGIFRTEESALKARDKFLAEYQPMPPKQYSTAWFQEQSNKQRIELSHKFANK